MDVAAIYYCEGAGHAMRMLSVVDNLERQGLEVEMIGGGPGEKFLDLNGYSEDDVPTVNYVKDFSEKGFIGSVVGSFKDALARLTTLRKWLSENDPEVVVTDDFFGAFAAFLEGYDYYFMSHVSFDIPENLTETCFIFLANKLVMMTAKEFFYPSMGGPRSNKVLKVGPIAYESCEKELEEGVDILAVPSDFSQIPEEVLQVLKDDDRSVHLVGSDDWELQPSLQPFIEEAELVLCGGYSTVMESAVAGTPCIIFPESAEQRGVAKRVSKLKGFREFSGDIREDVSSLKGVRNYENGAKAIADKIISDFNF